jgi:hypothetical protein
LVERRGDLIAVGAAASARERETRRVIVRDIAVLMISRDRTIGSGAVTLLAAPIAMSAGLLAGWLADAQPSW